jgi:hypothetical protein
VPVANGETQKAINTAISFAVSFFPQLKQYLPA